MKEHHLLIQKTARYYTLGELNEHTKHLWFVLHGFAQMADSFLKIFELLLDEETVFVAPEALNRFYTQGSRGVVGATWMTKADRLNEIKDYTQYLDDLHDELEGGQFPQAGVTVLGFSQGASTATRWVNQTVKRIDRLIVYAGEVGAEVLPLSPHSALRKTDNYFVYGDDDKYFPVEVMEKIKMTYSEMNFTEIRYSGGHTILPEVLKRFWQKI